MKPEARSYIDARKAFIAGTDTPRAFLERCLATLTECEPVIGAFVNLSIPAARAAADRATERWRAGTPLSAIDGMPVGIKDIMETADMPTEQGSRLFANWRTGRDAAAVAAIREAGGVVIGKTVTTEFAATVPGKTSNPWDSMRTPGGSSSGSAAAVASGMVSAALGSQVIGSILRPASYCGCYGFKPSLGAINRGGSYDSLSQSCTGVLAATLDETWIVARAISARVGGDPGYPGLSGSIEMPSAKPPRALALLETAGWPAVIKEAQSPFQVALKKLKAAGVEIVDRHRDSDIEAVEKAIFDATTLSRKINAWESRWPLNTYARDMRREGLSKVMQDRLAEAEAMTLEENRAHLRERQAVRDCYARLAAKYDGCITLSAPGPAPVGLATTGNPIFVVPGSLLGAPVLSLPLLEADGLPLGLQLLGFIEEDEALLGIAAAIRAMLVPAQP
jgi:Asp-tRNA(Asn)/Glu-tRNA(Gln) amidotransferase A subunit family amidase